ncbi:MAG: hypothetical protein O7H40_05975 [Gammaproteobacteria bacterium]|nr:hypothetical protein [Gammaproteobacteria bacterium]
MPALSTADYSVDLPIVSVPRDYIAARAVSLPRPGLVTNARCALLGANTPW